MFYGGGGFDITSDNNTVYYNNVYNNTEWGLYVYGDYNNITLNNFINNHIGYPDWSYRYSQATYEGSTSNITSNFWSDWSGTGNYSLDGWDHNNDTSPLVSPIPVFSSLTIHSPVTQTYASDSITVKLSGSSIIQYWYYIEGTDGQNHTWIGSEDRILPDGTYTLRAYGKNTIGETISDFVVFTIDSSFSLPNVSIISPSNMTYTSIGVPLSYTASDYQTLTIYLNDMANTTAVPSGSVVSDFPGAPTVPDGNYNITIVVENHAGNIATDTILFTIDTTGPIININSPTATTYNTGIITINLSSDDAVHYWYSINDDSNQTWIGSIDESLNDGSYVLHVYANDTFGNIGYAMVAFTIDTTSTTPTTATTTTTTTPIITTTKTTQAGPGGLLFESFLILGFVFGLQRFKRKRR